jgi:endonuclease YncB( thermonuclease family)
VFSFERIHGIVISQTFSFVDPQKKEAWTVRSPLLALFAALCLVLAPVRGLSWQAKVTEVEEANSLVVRTDSQERRVLLYGIGVPTGDEPFAQQARELARETVLGRTVEVDRTGSGDPVRAMVTPKGAGESLNEKILRKGLGWVHEAYCEKARLCGRLTRIKGRARREQRNLWAEVPGNQPAWKWVKEQDMEP